MTFGFRRLFAGGAFDDFEIFFMVLSLLFWGLAFGFVFLVVRIAIRLMQRSSTMANLMRQTWNIILPVSIGCFALALSVAILLPQVNRSSYRIYYIPEFITIASAAVSLNLLTLDRPGNFKWHNSQFIGVLAMIAACLNFFWASWVLETDYSWMGDHGIRRKHLPAVSPIFIPPNPDNFNRESWEGFFVSGGGGGPIGQPRLRPSWEVMALKSVGIFIFGFAAAWISSRLNLKHRYLIK